MGSKEIPTKIQEDIHTTIDYLHQRGPDFEEVLRKDDKFSFMVPGNEYYDYFIAHYKPKEEYTHTENVPTDNEEIRTPEAYEIQPKEPYTYKFSKYPTNVTKRDFDLIRKTALYCVVNGDEYIKSMKDKYKENELLAFLEPTHDLHRLFESFLNQYRLIQETSIYPPAIRFPKNNKNKNKKHIDLKQIILERCYHRAEYNEYLKTLQTVKDKLATEHKIQFSAINWTKFKIMETVSLENDILQRKPALDFKKLSIATINGSNDQLSIFDMELQEEQPEEEQQEDKTPGKEQKKGKKKMRIKGVGESRLKRKNDNLDDTATNKRSKKLIKCPITNEMIDEQSFDEHLRKLLNDPQLYKEEKQRYEKSHNFSNLTTDEVYQNIKRLVKKD